MQKQVIYPKFIPRLFSMMIDLLILSFVLTPFMNIIANFVFAFFFYDLLAQYNIGIGFTTLASASHNPDFLKALQNTTYAGKLFFNFLTMLFIYTIAMMAYFVIFWHKLGATPGKIFMRMKVVDINDYKKRPSVYNLCKRFLGYIAILPSIPAMAFSKKGLSLHDKMAGSVVIKS